MSRKSTVSAWLFITNSEKRSENAEETKEGRLTSGLNACSAMLVPEQSSYCIQPDHTPSVNDESPVLSMSANIW